MKLTKAEYRLIAASEQVVGGTPVKWLVPEAKELGERMRARGLISKRAWARGYVVATALGKRSHSYGKR